MEDGGTFEWVVGMAEGTHGGVKNRNSRTLYLHKAFNFYKILSLVEESTWRLSAGPLTERQSFAFSPLGIGSFL